MMPAGVHDAMPWVVPQLQYTRCPAEQVSGATLVPELEEGEHDRLRSAVSASPKRAPIDAIPPRVTIETAILTHLKISAKPGRYVLYRLFHGGSDL